MCDADWAARLVPILCAGQQACERVPAHHCGAGGVVHSYGRSRAEHRHAAQPFGSRLVHEHAGATNGLGTKQSHAMLQGSGPCWPAEL